MDASSTQGSLDGGTLSPYVACSVHPLLPVPLLAQTQPQLLVGHAGSTDELLMDVHPAALPTTVPNLLDSAPPTCRTIGLSSILAKSQASNREDAEFMQLHLTPTLSISRRLYQRHSN
ncbi:uncharacterized protein LOC119291404 [Triticum dicoccoides]|uniref:uncharacterized protein LOC119291404 n=1 Tax=Triticum dicoccoides TaxID=85692 RepID=UPI00189047E1|nr:uncharacterized protein LOC119291404 [Triticum dicoccoides]